MKQSITQPATRTTCAIFIVLARPTDTLFSIISNDAFVHAALLNKSLQVQVTTKKRKLCNSHDTRLSTGAPPKAEIFLSFVDDEYDKEGLQTSQLIWGVIRFTAAFDNRNVDESNKQSDREAKRSFSLNCLWSCRRPRISVTKSRTGLRLHFAAVRVRVQNFISQARRQDSRIWWHNPWSKTLKPLNQFSFNPWFEMRLTVKGIYPYTQGIILHLM